MPWTEREGAEPEDRRELDAPPPLLAPERDGVERDVVLREVVLREALLLRRVVVAAEDFAAVGGVDATGVTSMVV